MLKKNELYIVSIEDLNNLGYGVAKIDGMTVFVGDVADGDRVEIRIIHVNKTYAVARCERILVSSPHRTEHPECTKRGCGGCAYRSVTYAHEKALKENFVRFAFRKEGVADVCVTPLVSTDETCHYRNKAQYAVAADKTGKCIAGFFAPKSHRLIEACDCPLQHPAFPPIVRTVLDFANQNGITPYDEQSGRGLLRHIYLRAASTGEVLLTLVINGRALPEEETLVSHLQSKHPEVAGLYLNIHTARTNVICSDEYRHIYGARALRDTLAGVPLSLSPAAFYQVNHAAATLLYAKARELAALTGSESLLDLYCGVGSIGLSMAADARELVGVELVPEAVSCARENAAAMGLSCARFFAADAGDAESLFAAVYREMGKDYRPDVILLDPPRKGSTPELLTYIAEVLKTPRIVYISCNPTTLARDAHLLIQKGYALSPVTPFDLFPRTGHVESVVCLTRRLDN